MHYLKEDKQTSFMNSLLKTASKMKVKIWTKFHAPNAALSFEYHRKDKAL